MIYNIQYDIPFKKQINLDILHTPGNRKITLVHTVEQNYYEQKEKKKLNKKQNDNHD